uniref:Putative ovule protein n=1 Tax=Solanum chacoense TaxID=4108 RepID=A0A0V0GP84_SOLCH
MLRGPAHIETSTLLMHHMCPLLMKFYTKVSLHLPFYQVSAVSLIQDNWSNSITFPAYFLCSQQIRFIYSHFWS